MSPSPDRRFPIAAFHWLAGDPGQEHLLVGAHFPYVSTLVETGNSVTIVESDPHDLEAQLHNRSIRTVAARPAALPFRPGQFDRVIITTDSSDAEAILTLNEAGRVLRPDGAVATYAMSRDDTVPWVKRFMTLVHSVDPNAMQSTSDPAVAVEMGRHPFFLQPERRSFRVWIPVTRHQVVEMVSATPGARALSTHRLRTYQEQVGELYDELVPGSDALRLPYQLVCWRAKVNFAEVLGSLGAEETGLIIPL